MTVRLLQLATSESCEVTSHHQAKFPCHQYMYSVDKRTRMWLNLVGSKLHQLQLMWWELAMGQNWQLPLRYTYYIQSMFIPQTLLIKPFGSQIQSNWMEQLGSISLIIEPKCLCERVWSPSISELIEPNQPELNPSLNPSIFKSSLIKPNRTNWTWSCPFKLI